MIPINNLQSVIYKALNDNLDITVYDEEVPTDELELFDPDATWKRKVITDYHIEELLIPIFVNGKKVYESPTLKEMQEYCKSEVKKLWDEVKRFENPHRYYVDLSQKLWDIKYSLLNRK